VRCGLLLSAIRHQDPELSLALGHTAVEFRDRGVVGFDLAGDEGGFPAKRHREAFYLMKNSNMNITVHAGQEQGPESISQALHICGAHRLGDGTRLKESGELLNYVNDHRIALEICLSSSLPTTPGLTRLSDHPARFYYEYGLRVTLNTDSRLMCDTTLSRELHLAHQHLGFSLEDLKDIIVNGFKSAFLPLHEKGALLQAMLPRLGLPVPRAAGGR
jgi:adenosine deaminase